MSVYYNNFTKYAIKNNETARLTISKFPINRRICSLALVFYDNTMVLTGLRTGHGWMFHDPEC
jgi:hypothetical protein